MARPAAENTHPRRNAKEFLDAAPASIIDIRIRCAKVALMRTTLDIDPDVLQAAKEIGSRTKRSAGQVLSELARKALVSGGPKHPPASALVNGFEIIPGANRIVTPELVQQLAEASEQP